MNYICLHQALNCNHLGAVVTRQTRSTQFASVRRRLITFPVTTYTDTWVPLVVLWDGTAFAASSRGISRLHRNPRSPALRLLPFLCPCPLLRLLALSQNPNPHHHFSLRSPLPRRERGSGDAAAALTLRRSAGAGRSPVPQGRRPPMAVPRARPPRDLLLRAPPPSLPPRSVQAQAPEAPPRSPSRSAAASTAASARSTGA